MTEEQLFLAAAYVDDELTSDERVLAENDPVVWAEVQRQRSVQELASAVPPYSHDLQRAHIARAIEAAADNPAGAARVDELADRRRRRNRWLGGSIAAGVLVAVAGVAVVGLIDDSDDGVSGGAAPAATADEAGAAMASAEDTASASDATMADSGAASETMIEDGNPDDPAAAGSGPVVAQLEDTSPVRFTNDDELVEAGRRVIAQAALFLLDPPEPDCEIITESGQSLPPLAEAILVGEDDQPVLLTVEPLDDLTFRVIVADPDDCSILMSASGSFDR